MALSTLDIRSQQDDLSRHPERRRVDTSCRKKVLEFIYRRTDLGRRISLRFRVHADAQITKYQASVSGCFGFGYFRAYQSACNRTLKPFRFRIEQPR